ncbi:hypothetical protein QVD17_02122 [Tagetes erecta]|uniref:Uncharacterized protein n=1 Tax=Tagetes erecta TaxID=13708 RepID=A0AAD8LB16_TARER|nr:hypothetical protein QVD17_02122 [Tagetes erecta]
MLLQSNSNQETKLLSKFLPSCFHMITNRNQAICPKMAVAIIDTISNSIQYNTSLSHLNLRGNIITLFNQYIIDFNLDVPFVLFFFIATR